MSELVGPSLSKLVRAARRRRGWTQIELARRIGATQSQISNFENHQTSALSVPKMAAAAEALGIDLTPHGMQVDPTPFSVRMGLKFCPTPDCPTNVPTLVQEELLLRPAMVEAPAAHTTWCGDCGELLLDRCGECGEAAREGSCCPACGRPWVTVPPAVQKRAEAWSAERLAVIRELRELTQTRRIAHGTTKVEAPRPARR